MSHHRLDTRELPNLTTHPQDYAIGDVARLLSMSVNTVKRKAEAGEFGPLDDVVWHTPGGHWRFRRRPIDNFRLHQQQQQPLF